MIQKQVQFRLGITPAIAEEDFLVFITPENQSVPQGTQAVYTVSIEGVGGYNRPVNLVVLKLPQELTAKFNVNPALPGDTVFLTIYTGNADVSELDLTLEATEANPPV